MPDLEELLHQKIDQLEAALTAERERADGLQRQLDRAQLHVDSLQEIVRANAVASVIPVIVHSPMSQEYTALAEDLHFMAFVRGGGS